MPQEKTDWEMMRATKASLPVLLRLAVFLLLLTSPLHILSCRGNPRSDKAPGTLSSKSVCTSTLKTDPGGAQRATAHITNSIFLFAPNVRTTRGVSEHLVLRETIEYEESPELERDNGDVVVEAFPAIGATEASMLWKIQSKGISGGIFDTLLFRIVQTACCGASERTVYYSLADGRELFSSTLPVTSMEHAGTREKRYIGFDDGHGSTLPREIQSDDSILGIITYSSETALLHKAALLGNRARECRAISTGISIGNRQPETVKATLFRYEATPTFDGVEVVVELECVADGVVENCRIPISGDLPSVSQATTSNGLQVKAMN